MDDMTMDWCAYLTEKELITLDTALDYGLSSVIAELTALADSRRKLVDVLSLFIIDLG